MTMKIRIEREPCLERECHKDKLYYIIKFEDTKYYAEKLFIDDEEVDVGQNDIIFLEAYSIKFVNGAVNVYKEARIYTNMHSIKEVIKYGLEEVRWIVIWATRRQAE
ncbi:MAG: hypothetical protein JHC26_09810 [Thermofilum sp.]|jgi:hypothetical protein|uniref:hypothetical protein n=1 Tax=Thermofilum sp. TaxID=1961369 RepID=UPI00258970BA|nr:hypothetical protein [Thermofilum sp.]MCI4409377.1 hypothetical protein [Thermofilum sp.]